MINLANSLEEGSFGIKLVDHIVGLELKIAGINRIEEDKRIGEPKTKISGEFNGWKFTRAWYYWVAETVDRPLPVGVASEMHETLMEDGKGYGNVIRVGGDCSCPHPEDMSNWFLGSKIVLPVSEKLKYEEYIKNGHDYMQKAMDKYVFSDDPGSIGAIKCVKSYHIDTQEGLNLFAKTLFQVWQIEDNYRSFCHEKKK